MGRRRHRDETAIVVGFSPARLSAARERRNMSRKMLADAIGVDCDDIADWEETGKPAKPMREYTLRLLCCALGGVYPDCLVDPPLGRGAGV